MRRKLEDWMVGACGAHITQNIRFISRLGSAIGKTFNTYFGLLQQEDQKKTLSANESSGERILIFGLCLRCNLKWV
jgi:hypothetical protein